MILYFQIKKYRNSIADQENEIVRVFLLDIDILKTLIEL